MASIVRANSSRKLFSLSAGRTIVLKVGSASLTNESGDAINAKLVCCLVDVICQCRKLGHRVVLVTSGAVAIGCMNLKMTEKPTDIISKQAIAAVGQAHLMTMYNNFFSLYKQPIAQVLMDRDSVNHHHHYKNSLNTLHRLLEMGIVPIVNENDTCGVAELRVGDNDTLSAVVASILQADFLVLLTDVDALYTADPGSDPNARPIHVVRDLNDLDVDTESGSGKWGTGGMATKIRAARIACAAGVTTVVCHSKDPEVVIKVCLENAKQVGTVFEADQNPIRSEQKRWIAHGRKVAGTIVVDDGAAQGVRSKASLFAAGIVEVIGKFAEYSNVLVKSRAGGELGRGLCNYDSEQLGQIKGKKSSQYADVLGFEGPGEVIHRSNLVVGAMVLLESPQASQARVRPQGIPAKVALSDKA